MFDRLNRNKKGSLEGMTSLAIGITTLLVLIAVMFVIMAQVKSQTTTASGGVRVGCNTTSTALCTIAENSTNTLIEAGATIPGWVGIIVIVAIGAMILGMLTMFGKR